MRSIEQHVFFYFGITPIYFFTLRYFVILYAYLLLLSSYFDLNLISLICFLILGGQEGVYDLDQLVDLLRKENCCDICVIAGNDSTEMSKFVNNIQFCQTQTLFCHLLLPNSFVLLFEDIFKIVSVPPENNYVSQIVIGTCTSTRHLVRIIRVAFQTILIQFCNIVCLPTTK